MSPSSGISAFGVTLKRDGTAIAEITNIGGVEVSRAMIDFTNNDSADIYREFKPGLKDSSEVSISGNFKAGDTNGQVGLLTDFEAGTLQAFILTFPTSITATWTFSAYVTKFKVSDFAVDGKVSFNASLKISGKPTLAVTASTGMSALTGIEEQAGGAITLLPTFAIGTFAYTVTVNTLSTYIKLTPTAATHVITISNGTSEQTVTSGAQSGEIDLGVAGTITTITVTVTESGKTAKVYTITVSRP